MELAWLRAWQKRDSWFNFVFSLNTIRLFGKCEVTIGHLIWIRTSCTDNSFEWSFFDQKEPHSLADRAHVVQVLRSPSCLGSNPTEVEGCTQLNLFCPFKLLTEKLSCCSSSVHEVESDKTPLADDVYTSLIAPGSVVMGNSAVEYIRKEPPGCSTKAFSDFSRNLLESRLGSIMNVITRLDSHLWIFSEASVG